jgi:uncharacterized protein (UPF0276 family)
MASTFLQRARHLPHLGVGVSTEYGAQSAPDSLDILALRERHPRFAQFLEVGIETLKGIDGHAVTWIDRGWPTTYHFLDINLDDPADFDEAWMDQVRGFVDRVRPAWLCGDAGLWHFGPRDRGHMLLLPPILSDASASAQAEGIVRLRDGVGLEVLPENPPGAVFVGDLHLLDFFARVCEHADTGMLLDCAHLAIYQRTAGHDPLTGLDAFPLDRLMEMHVAGSTEQNLDGYLYYEDAHTPLVLDDTWRIFEYAAQRAPNLKAVVFECERNPLDACLPGFERIASILRDTSFAAV